MAKGYVLASLNIEEFDYPERHKIETIKGDIRDKADLERDLRRAVEREEFETHYQPIVELHTGEIFAVEALARWRHPERGLVEAEEFIEVAEETGLIRAIGQKVVEEACLQVKEWCRRYPQQMPMLSINLSANQFIQQPDLVPKVLDKSGLEPSALQVEFTERAVMDDAEFALGELKGLKELGVSLAIDTSAWVPRACITSSTFRSTSWGSTGLSLSGWGTTRGTRLSLRGRWAWRTPRVC